LLSGSGISTIGTRFDACLSAILGTASLWLTSFATN
jgi:hypothetical protein